MLGLLLKSNVNSDTPLFIEYPNVLFYGASYYNNMTWFEFNGTNNATSAVEVPVVGEFLNIGGQFPRRLILQSGVNFIPNSFHAVINSNGGLSSGRNGVIIGNYNDAFDVQLEITGTYNVRLWWNNSPDVVFNSSIPLNTNILISVVRDSATNYFHLYLNGAQRESFKVTNTGEEVIPGPLPFVIGRDHRTTYPFHGQIGLIYLNNHVFSAADVLAFYEQIADRFLLR